MTHYNFKVCNQLEEYADTFPAGTFDDAPQVTCYQDVVDERARRNRLANEAYLKGLEDRENHEAYVEWLGACYDDAVDEDLTVIDLHQLKASEQHLTTQYSFKFGWPSQSGVEVTPA